MFNKGKIIAAAAMALAVNSAMAADSVDVKVIGTIVPAACKPALSGGATIDYGTIKASAINMDDYTSLPIKTVEFSIKCDAPSKVAIRSIDLQKDSRVIPVGQKALDGKTYTATSKYIAGLGSDNGKKVGGYGMILIGTDVTIDGSITPGVIFSDNNGASWNGGTSNFGAWITPGTSNYTYSFSKDGENTPLAFTTLTGTLQTQAYINKGSELDLTKAVHLNGQTTIELYYL